MALAQALSSPEKCRPLRAPITPLSFKQKRGGPKSKSKNMVVLSHVHGLGSTCPRSSYTCLIEESTVLPDSRTPHGSKRAASCLTFGRAGLMNIATLISTTKTIFLKAPGIYVKDLYNQNLQRSWVWTSRVIVQSSGHGRDRRACKSSLCHAHSESYKAVGRYSCRNARQLHYK